MNKTIGLIIAGLIISATTVGHTETLRFAPLPMENRETVVKQFLPLTTFLENRLNIKIEYVYFDSYSKIVEAFQQAQIDLAYLGPLPYVELRALYAQAEPIVHFKEESGEASYTCALVGFGDGDFDPKNAKQRKIALTQPLSTCGFLSTSGLLRQYGSDLNQNLFRYLGKHDEVALSIIRGKYDAGGLKTAIAKKYTHMGLQILAETPPLPAFALVANTSALAAQRITEIRRVLVALDPKGKDQDLLSTWGDNIRYGSAPAKDGDYDAVRQLLKGTTIPLDGNF
ncbi:MAG: PhnD/SsuA/transferrin family substrate-binding protein [Desulfatitalea sp.]